MKKHLLFIAFVVLGLSSCKKEEPTATEHKPITALELVKTKDAIIGEATSLELKISPYDMNGSGELVWASSDETIATVNPADRTIKGLKEGTVTVTVASKESPGITSSCQVNVLEKVVAFDDAVFENLMLEKFDANKDKRITGEEVDKVTALSIPNIGTDEKTRIKSMTGIEAFLSLETLDVSGNPALGTLVLYEMKEDPAAKADAEKPKKAFGTTKLKNLNISGTAIQALVIEECKAIESLNISKTSFAAFDFTKATAIKTLDISETSLAEADFSKCAALETLTGKSSALKFVDLSNNTKVKAIDFIGNKSLEKVLHHEDITPNADWKVEASTIIEKGAYDAEEIVIPDATFKASIISLYDINYDGKIYAEEAAKITGLTIGSGIKSITGSEKFPNLESLTVDDSNTELTAIDLSPYKELKEFENNSPELASVLFGGCPSLEILEFYSTKDLVIKNMPNLITVSLRNPGDIETINISGCPEFQDIINTADCEKLTSFELTDANKLGGTYDYQQVFNSTKLKNLVIKSTSLKNVTIHNAIIESFNTESVPALESLSLTNVPALKALDLKGNVELTELTVTGSLIEALDLSKNTKLIDVDVSLNKLTALNTSTLAKLEELDVHNNAIVVNKEKTGLDVSANPLLQSFYFGNNKVESIDISKNNKWLIYLNGEGNPLAQVWIAKDQKTTGFIVPNTTVFEIKK